MYLFPHTCGIVNDILYKEDLKYMTRKLKETYENWGLDINLNKTKYLCIGETHSSLKLEKTVRLNVVNNINI
jgi:hypothetical protein